jgi:hypothetical protein
MLARHIVLSNSPATLFQFTDNPIIDAGFLSGRLTALGVLGHEILLLVFPAFLSADYSYNAIPLATGFTLPVVVGAIVLAAALVLAGWGYLHNRKIFFLVLFGLGALLPTANLLFPIGTIMAERFLYVPAIAFAGCLVTLIWSLRGRIGLRGAQAIFAAVVLILAARTFARNFDWQTELALFKSAASVVPDSFRVRSALAGQELAAGDLDGAVRDAERTMQILDPLPDDRNTSIPYVTAGKVFSDKADSLPVPERAPWQQKALTTLRRAERLVALQARPGVSSDYPLLDEHLGYVALQSGAYDEAINAVQRSMRRHLSADLFINLAAAFIGKGDAADGEITMLEGMIWNRQDSAIATKVIEAYRLKSPDSCALANAGNGAYRLNTTCPLVQTQLCAASARLISLLQVQGQTSEVMRVQSAAQHAGCSK